ncbi:CBL-interacting protein kinase 9 [Zostera marina]|uniref:non-specific serine/threonine protein kinase n=1 Tax=Zostera marina TaxID=29655 RepID=A0A0K9PTJ7_ZOSMR|nr:CBL-interacting protein kinase 9 [Zostera marina]
MADMRRINSTGSMDKATVLHGKYEMGRLLGHGNFAKVYMARDIKSNRIVAIKVVKKEMVVRVGMVEQVKREISVMKMVKHPNVVEIYEVMATKSNIYIAMEFVQGGELFAKIVRAGRIKEDVARVYFRQLISTVDHCHSRGVCHRDLKPENLLLDLNGNLKIADFGFSAFADDHLRADGLLHTTCGTPAYVAPEILSKRGYDGAKTDIWSCGVILYVLLAGRLPFTDQNLPSMYKKIYKGEFKFPAWFSYNARRLITKLLDPKPNTRLTIPKIIDSQWFKNKAEETGQGQIGESLGLGQWGKDKPEVLNAFHIISLSEGFDLSPLFEEKKREKENEGMRFATREPASEVISRMEALANGEGGSRKFVVNKSENEIRLESVERGRKGRLVVAAEVFSISKEVLVVDVKREYGDSLDCKIFFSDHIRPALKDIVWES